MPSRMSGMPLPTPVFISREQEKDDKDEREKRLLVVESLREVEDNREHRKNKHQMECPSLAPVDIDRVLAYIGYSPGDLA